jgi:hypothetical protein
MYYKMWPGGVAAWARRDGHAATKVHAIHTLRACLRLSIPPLSHSVPDPESDRPPTRAAADDTAATPPPRPPPAAAPAATGGPGPGPRAGGSSRRPGSKVSVGGAAGGGWRPAAAAGPDGQSCCVMDPWGGPSLTEILAEPTSGATVPPIPIVSMRASFSAPLVHHAGGA